jgi:hypothetical protein
MNGRFDPTLEDYQRRYRDVFLYWIANPNQKAIYGCKVCGLVVIDRDLHMEKAHWESIYHIFTN